MKLKLMTVEKVIKVNKEKMEMKAEQAIKPLISDKALCEAWGCSPVTTWRLRNSGQLEYCRVAGAIRYTPEAIERYVKDNTRTLPVR